MIQVTGLVKRYGERVVLDHISFSVGKGEILGFLGQNGAGKTTTMKILATYMPATEGRVKVAGYDVFEDPLEVKKRIGYLPEQPPLYLELLVEEYLMFVAELRGVERSRRKQRVDWVVRECELEPVRKRLIRHLSKGYCQRVGIAGALVHDPEVLILDEPTIGLDPRQLSHARQLIRSMKGKKTVIYSSHILSEVEATCDRVIVIEQGKLVAEKKLDRWGEGEEGGVVSLEIEGNVHKVKDMVAKIEGVKRAWIDKEQASSKIWVETTANNRKVMAQISELVVSSGEKLISLSPGSSVLEDYYLSLISGSLREKANA